MSVDIPVGQNYLDLDDETVVLNGCEEQEFAVQAISKSVIIFLLLVAPMVRVLSQSISISMSCP